MKINLKKLDFGYQANNLVLNQISFDFDRPEFICILGPNGVGKSTLIHCMNKILKPTGGVIMIDDKEINNVRLKDLSKRMGYVPNATEDSFPMTVMDTVMVGLPGDCRFSIRSEDIRKVRDVLRLLDVEDLAMCNFNELSAGQHQKIMIARGLVREPEVLLLDEPTSNLDIKHQIEVTKLLSQLPARKKMTVIMISHDINITAKFTDRIILMANGGIYAVGTPKEVLTRENLATVYGVDADVVEINGRPHVILNDAVSKVSANRDDGPYPASVSQSVVSSAGSVQNRPL